MKQKITFTILLSTLLSISVFAQKSYLKVDQEDIKQGDKIELQYITEKPLTADTWVGMYKKGASSSNTSDGRISYGYIKDAESYTNTWTGPPLPGEYEFRLISEKKLLFTLPFVVYAIDEREVELELLTTKILPSQDFKFKINTELHINRSSRLGIYKYSKPLSKSQGGYYKSSFYYYRNSDNILTMKAPTETGIYEIRFHGSSNKIFIKRMVFYVGEPSKEGLSFSLDKKKYQPGETITLSYTGNQDLFERTWFGMFKNSDAKYSSRMAYRYIENIMKGTITFKAPNAEGLYDIKWFYADQGPILLTPQEFEVNGSIAEKDDVNKESFKQQLEKDGKIILDGIYFDFNKSNLRKESRAVIKQLADMLNANTTIKVSIDGHTDNVGTEHYNQKLSERRAAEVRRALIDVFGVDSEQLTSKGYGEADPIAENKTESGRAKNRRVEVVKL